MSLVEELQQAAGAALERVAPAVVAVGRDHRGAGAVTESGRIVTNAHNLRDRTTRITFADGRTAQATVLGVDGVADLAVLEVDTGPAPAVTWADAGAVAPGQVVFGITQDGQGARITIGFVSAVNRAFRGPRGRLVHGAIEHSAPLPRGSSGGPLVALDGSVIGLNTHRLRGGLYLASPADATLAGRLAALGRGEATEPPQLGVALAAADVAARMRTAVGLPARPGLLVRGVVDGSPAQRAGIAVGDLLSAVDGHDIADADDLHRAIARAGRHGSVELTVVRGTEDRVVRASFAEPEDGEAP